MSELTSLTINVTSEQRQRLEYLSKTYEYESVEAYVLSIIEQVLEEPTKEEILEGLRVSFRQALNGETIPIEDVLAELEADDEE